MPFHKILAIDSLKGMSKEPPRFDRVKNVNEKKREKDVPHPLIYLALY